MPERKAKTDQGRQGRMAAAAAGRTSAAAAPGKTAERTKPIRITVDLDVHVHRALTSWANATALRLDAPRVSLSDVVRAMIGATTGNADMTNRVTESLKTILADRES